MENKQEEVKGLLSRILNKLERLQSDSNWIIVLVVFASLPVTIDGLCFLKRKITEQNLQGNNTTQEQVLNKLNGDARQLEERFNKSKEQPEKQ
ncbi:MAG: hypothetical protein EB000_05330 [Alphaproteobacteria bacterium]|nr:hypothetical protein [Alphaproteobacteria bacterium]